ncbi:MAG: type IV toxin-antitoxin system AbiEi family antitoxin [Planctomycetota bacterium]
MLLDDKRLILLQEIAVTFSDTEVSVTLADPSESPDMTGAWRGEIRRRGGWQHSVLLYPVRGALGIAVVDRVSTAARDVGAPVIVVAAAVGRELRAELTGRGLGYLDLAGNCHLELDAGNVTVHIEGQRRASRPAGTGSLRAAGYQVLFALLADERLLERTMRDIAEKAGSSRHAAHSLVERLRDEGVLQRAGRSRHVFAPGGREKCIDRFTAGWADVLRGRLLIGRYQLREREPRAAVTTIERAFHAAQVPFGFGGAHGSSRWLHYLQSDETVVHTATFGPELAREIGAVPDRQGPLFVFRTMTKFDFAPDAVDTAHPLLIHAELARSKDPRARETAALLLEKVAPRPR